MTIQPSSAGSATPEDFAALREVEVEWLIENLSDSISNLSYPVGCGLSPTYEHLKFAANRLFDRYAKMIEMARNAGGGAQTSIDPADGLAALVDGFGKALLAKLKLAHADGRRGWEKNDWERQCQQGLLRHIAKGDPRDVAAYCAFMWHHGWITIPAAPTQGGDKGEAVAFCGWHPIHGYAYQTCDHDQKHAESLLMRMDLAGDHGWSVEPLYAAPQPQTLGSMIQAIYNGMDAEDCSFIDFEWARQRGYTLPDNGTGKLTNAHHTQGGDKGEPWAYYIEHPKYGVELSLDQPSARAIELGWVGTPLYTAPAYTAPDRTAWLIEMPERFGPLYFHFEHDDDWTKDHDTACHFARKEDAERVIEHYGWTRAVAVEHMWPASSLSAEMKTAVASARASAAARRVTPITRRSEADSYFQILQAIARFPITDPKNMDAVNMRLIAEGALAIPSTHQSPDNSQQRGALTHGHEE